MSDNIFSNFCFEYRDILKEIGNKIQSTSQSGLLKKSTKIDLSKLNLEGIKTSYDYIKYSVLNTNDTEKWLFIVKEFMSFLPVAQKCYCVSITDQSDYSIEYRTDNSRKKLTINFNDHIVSILTEQSEIKVETDFNLLDFLNNSEAENIEFINIYISSNEISDEFNFIYSSSSSYEIKDELDIQLFDNIKFEVSEFIFDTFNDILNNKVKRFTNCNKYNIEVKDLINNGKYLRIC